MGLYPAVRGRHPEVALGHCMKRLSLGTNRQTGLGSFWKAEADCLGAGGFPRVRSPLPSKSSSRPVRGQSVQPRWGVAQLSHGLWS